MNEHRNGWYSSSSYFLARGFIDVPVTILFCFLYLWYGYYGTSQPEMDHWYQGIYNIPERFQLFVLFTLLGIFACQSKPFQLSTLFNI